MNSLPINNEYCLCAPFCDYLNITSPKENQNAILELIKPFLDYVGCLEQFAGTFQIPPSFGTFKTYTRGQVCVFSASGGLLHTFRELKLYDQYLTVFADFEHRISMLHATVDLRLDAPEILDLIYQKATAGGMYLTRKAIDPKNVSKLTGKNLEGVDTGTVYLGNRANSDVWAKAYDKRQERIQKGFADPMQMLRLEIAVQSDVGASLRDASNPHDLFYHFASKSLVTAPDGFKGWEPHGTGFMLEKKTLDLTPWQQIKGILENSLDIKRCIDLAITHYGVDAEKELCKLVRNRYLLSERSIVANI